MKLQGRSLKPNMRGDDVKLLQTELRQLGFTIPNELGFFDSTTFLAVKAFQQQHNLPAIGIVDAKTARAINAELAGRPREGYLVTGNVVRADGSPVVRVVVAVIEKLLRSERQLGNERTDRQGQFEIRYPRPEVMPFSILVRVSDTSGAEIATSDLICDAGPHEIVNLVVGGEALRGPSEFDQLERILRPGLAAEQVEAADLNQDDIKFLACKFSLDPEHVALYVISARHQRETGLATEWFYGLLRQGLPVALTALIAQSLPTLRDAFHASMDRNLITPQPVDRIERMLQELQNQIVQLSLRDPTPDRQTFKALFDIARVAPRHQQGILERYIQREGTVEEFWQQLRDDPDIPTDEVNALADTLGLSTIALNHVPLVNRLRRMQQTGDLEPGLRSLARFDQDGWREVLSTTVAGSRIGAPHFFGEDEEERIERYAQVLPKMVESVIPTAVLTERLRSFEGGDVDFAPALGFLGRHPDFEFRDTLVQRYLDQHDDALDGIPRPDETVATLKRMQRLFRIAPEFNKAQAIAVMMARPELISATAIRQIGPTRFINDHRATLGPDTAAQIYSKAANTADTAVYLLSQTDAFNPVWTAVIKPQVVGDNIPSFEDLFGAHNLCKCEHCESVFSPAAYLVEILNFLAHRPGDVPSRRALDVLFDRRPEIGEIELSCHNTNTSLPYVDLVLEILETAVVNGGTLSVTEDDDEQFPFQTIGDEVSLGANPEHQNAQAYEIIRGAAYPWSLPFDLWYAEVRGYLGHAGVAYHELLRAFTFDSSAETEVAVASESLGLTPRDRELITDVDAETLVIARLWGFESANALTAFAASANAGQIRDRSGLTYDELTGLLEVNYVNPDGILQIQFDGADCDLDHARITNLDVPALDRIHRFVRLWRTQAWSQQSLDAVLSALHVGELTTTPELDDRVLTHLSMVTALHRELQILINILLSWLHEELSTTGNNDQPSLYEDIFLDSTVHNPALDVFALNEAREDLVHNGDPLSNHLTLTSSALGVSVTDLNVLIETELQNPAHTLANLTRLYQVSSLVKALGLTIRGYVTLRRVLNISPFGDGAIDRLNQFVDVATRVKTTPFTISELDYVLRHQETGAVEIGPANAGIASILVALRTDLLQMSTEHQVPRSSVAILQLTEKKLTEVIPDTAAQILAIINLSSNQSEEDQISLIEQELGFFMETAAVVDDWFAPDETERTVDPARRAEMVLAPLTQHLQRGASEELVVQTMAQAHNIPSAVSHALVSRLIAAPGDAESLLDVFLAEDFAPQFTEDQSTEDFEETTTAEHFPDQFNAFLRMAKTVFVLQRLEVPPEEYAFYFDTGIALGWLDPNALPLTSQEQTAIEFTTFLTQAELFQLASRMFGGLVPLFRLLGPLQSETFERQDFLQQVSSLTGWGVDDVSYLTGSTAENLTYPEGFRNGQFLLQLKTRIDLLRAISESAETVHRWVSEPVTEATAQSVKQTIRAKYRDRTHWLTVAKPLRDEIREQQRTALVEYLLHDLSLDSANDLYGQFLIDVEMSPCMLTTRVALAISSVQLFVQRILLNLEAVKFSPNDVKEWSYLKHYREREAARKVMIYPENYIHPELRDDKTELFEQLEAGLLQGEANEATAEFEFRKYLNSLSQIARLDISGIARQWDVSQDVLHVFGRTRNSPHEVFYRRWMNRKYWTPWQRVDVEINSDHIVPVVWQERLYLFWPVFQETAEPDAVEDEEVPPPPKRYFEIRMSWSEYRNGVWLPTQITDDFLSSTPSTSTPKQKSFRFWPQFDDANRLYIVVSNIRGKQFRMDAQSDRLRVTDAIVTPADRWPFPGTEFYYDKLKEQSGGSKPLTVSTAGQTVDFAGVQYLDNGKTTQILRSTPGTFELVLPSEEQLFKSKSPFFYSDQIRTFLVVPSGGYTGGASEPGFGIQVNQNTTPTHTYVPLELPDAITSVIAVAGTPTQRTSVTEATTAHSEPTRDVSNLLVAAATAAVTYSPWQWEARVFRFDNHYHPYITFLLNQLARHGIEGVLKPDPEKEPPPTLVFHLLRRQLLVGNFFQSLYAPVEELLDDLSPVPREEFDFSYAGAYSIYNWELFFHIPFILAKRLSENQQFAAAQRWFHFIFNPTDAPQDPNEEPLPERAWQIKPFFLYGKGQTVQASMLLLRGSGLNSEERSQRKQLRDQIEAWRKDPYNPHTLARLGPQAYMKSVVMAYLENLITWGDQLFRLDTRESINEATQLFILANEILGNRPEEIAAHEDARKTINGEVVNTFNDLRTRLDVFSNALVAIETELDPTQTVPAGARSYTATGSLAFAEGGDDEELDFFLLMPGIEPPDDDPPQEDRPLAKPIPTILGPSLYFCIPKNDRLLKYWDIVADRLFKLRNCMNIDGIIRRVSPFAPPIDPDLLVKAAATGVDINSALRELNAPIPLHRFQVLAGKATELIGEVKSLGSALLSALEKKDAEALSLIRETHTIAVLELTELVRVNQRDTAVKQKQATLATRASALTRYENYEYLLGGTIPTIPESTADGNEIQLRPFRSNLRLQDVPIVDLQTTGDNIEATLSLSDAITAVIDSILKKTPLGKLKNTLKKLPLFGDLFAAIFNKGLPDAKKFLTDNLLPDKIGIDLSTALDDESQELSVELNDFLKDLTALRLLLQEKGELNLLSEAKRFALGAGSHQELAAQWRSVRAATISFSPFGIGLSTTIGGDNLSAAVSAKAESLSKQSLDLNFGATLTSKIGQYILRAQDWTLQSNLAAREIMQIDKQLLVAELQIENAEKELTSHRRQIQNARDTATYMESKYTSTELYAWMVSEISSTHRQAYQLAYDLAKAAERAYRYELGLKDSSFIKPDRWESRKSGLLAGERLFQDVKRMEVAYLDENRREYELTKHISVARLNPMALLQLKEEGRCEIELPEELWDTDYQGHYFRRIKSVGITIPAVTGPYTTISCTLRLLRSSIRRQSNLLSNDRYVRDVDSDDPRFSDTFGAIQSISTSSGRNDSGLFELNFRDERYLPFEGAGAISRWQVEMPNEFRQFDYDSISDVILHINYTAREGGAALRDAATQHLQAGLNALVTGADAPGMHQSFSARHAFPTELHRFLHPSTESAQQTLMLNLTQNRFPYMFKNRDITVDQVHVIVRLADELVDADGLGTAFTLVHPGGEDQVDLGAASSIGSLRQVSIGDMNSSPGAWTLTVASVGNALTGEPGRLDPNAIEDIIFVLHYTIT